MEHLIKSKLKILHVASGDLWAGAEVMILSLLRHLNKQYDMDISVILLNEGRLAEELKTCGLVVEVIDEKGQGFSEILRKALNIISRKQPVIIHSHRYKENFLAFLVSRLISGLKPISTQHGLPELPNNAGLIEKIKTTTNFSILSRHFTTVAVSNDIRSNLVGAFGFRKEHVRVVHNGVEIPACPSPKEKALPFVIGSSGRLFPIKDYPLMVQVASIVDAHVGSGVRFELAGDGPGRIALRDMIQGCGLDPRFSLNGHQHDMAQFYRGLGLYINTSIHEGIPITILEALAHGLPVIAPAVGGIVEIIEDGKEGFLIDSRDPRSFAEKCLLLMKNDELRYKMAKAARAKVEKSFSAERMAESYYKIYTEPSTESSRHFSR